LLPPSNYRSDLMTKTEAVRVIRDARERGIDFAEIDRMLMGAGISVPEMVDAYREAGRRDAAEADALERFVTERC
jgi:aminoglycoside/choline kinase family phosphotransferase